MSFFDLFKKKTQKVEPSISAPPSGARIVGVYSMPGVSDCFLFEMEFDISPLEVDVSKIMHRLPGTKNGDEQAPFEEKYLDDDGVAVIGDFMNKPKDKSKTRICFFLYCFDFDVPLSTQFGEVPLCGASKMPERLKKIISFDKEMFD